MLADRLCSCLGQFRGRSAQPVKEPPPTKTEAPPAAPSRKRLPTKTQSAAELAVRKAASNFDQAFNTGSADKIAGLWTADAEYIDEDGQRYVGRDVIKKEYAEFFAANPQAKISSVTDSVRVINETTAVEDGRAMIQPPPAGRRGQPLYGDLRNTFTTANGFWRRSTI